MTRYQVRVDGHLDRRWSSWFGHLSLAHQDDGTTTLTGAVADQPELHGLLARVRDLGVTLISVQVVDATVAGEAERPLQERT